ncbi:MAG: BatA domain-containing protein, partial [Bacteroidota bacterium]
MTFLNPFLLVGLAAAAIPIIIHLLNLRKLKTVEFSSLRFLKELQKTKMRRVKIRQILLLILRTLLIIIVVLAFARPALRGSVGTIGAHARSTIVILLDDSPSMSVRD